MVDITIYQAENGTVEVRLEQDTVWLRQEQMSRLFGRERSVITKHLRNVFAEGELDEESNVQNLHIAGSDKPVRFYNLCQLLEARKLEAALQLVKKATQKPELPTDAVS